ncbi:FecCD family ABC transporter permease [Fodinicola feengrottensis]|uniref:Iron chelate uptake ABC transporter family permease subunit n=1 Tax=Fodinicola feengrottensis TaxID=435914 RepID=A0ABN2GGP1_9ACTN|nr:iron chelate uptake ABC transporter family permease subunit [Fodinicola feengrottensis]
MSKLAVAAPAGDTVVGPEAAGRRHRSIGIRLTGLLVGLTALGIVAIASIAIGARAIPLGVTLDSLFGGLTGRDAEIIRTLRIPRTLLGAEVGVALGLAGALMQALTRNPLADPGILGVTAGASAAVVTAIAFIGIASLSGYVWFALLGAAAAMVLVYTLANRGRGGATPVRLALAGTAITFALGAYVSGVSLLDTTTFDQFRFWVVGSLGAATYATVWQVTPFLLVGALLALSLVRPLNAIALGEDTSRALGAKVELTRGVGVVAITLMCGAATAAVGPIAFVGLTVPHIARAITGPDQRWVLPYSLVISPALLLAADVAGRWLGSPGELQVGIVTPLIGAPLFVWLVRGRRVPQL